MSTRSGSGSADYGQFDQLAEEFAERYRRGERPSLQEYIDRCPELADEIRELFPALVEVEIADEEQQVLSESVRPAPALAHQQVGDYRILREAGRGGMGVVYEAEQVSLGRRVALKVLPRQVAQDVKTLARFRREARSAAQLHHTNIVPVFEVGKDGELSYYAMQFIQGQGLDQVIEELRRLKDRSRSQGPGSVLPSAPRSRLAYDSPPAPRPPRDLTVMAESLLTGRFVPELHGMEATEGVTSGAESTVAQGGRAVGTLTDPGPKSDCDPSPAPGPASSAVLPGGTQISTVESGRKRFFRSVAHIGRQVASGLAYAHARGIIHRDIKPSNLLLDTNGVVWITDFGLAKGIESGLTQDGDILGTLRYMAPERFRGEGDARSDVYALGLTLYELLTLRPGFESPDRLKLIEQVKTLDPPAPRTVDPRVPRDLETIILTAIDKDPKGRYATADALGEDLRRFLDDESILSRREGLAERYLRWARRNQAIAVLGGVLSAILLLATIGSLLAANHMRGLVEDQRSALNEARAERRAADLAREDEMTQRVEADKARVLANLRWEQAEANFAKARAAVDEYLTKVTDSQLLTAPGLQSLRADLLGSALTFYDDFLKERGDDPSLRAAQADVHLRVSRIAKERGDEKAAAESAGKAATLYQALLVEHPGDVDAQTGRLEALYRMNDYRGAIALGERLIEAHPENRILRNWLADAYNGLYIVLSGVHDQEGAIDALEQSLPHREALLRDEPDDPEYALGMSRVLNNLGALLQQLRARNDFDTSLEAEALPAFRRALMLIKSALVRKTNDYTTGRGALTALANVGRLQERLGLTQAASETYREGLEMSRLLAASNPDVPMYVNRRFTFASVLGDELWEKKRRTEAIAAYREAIEAAQSPAFVRMPLWATTAMVAARLANSQHEQPGEPKPGLNPPIAPDNTDRERMANLAIDAIRKAIADGTLTNAAWMRNSSILKPLQDRQDFRALLAQLESKDSTGNVMPNGHWAFAGLEASASSEAATPAIAPSLDRAFQLRSDVAAAHHAIGVIRRRFGQWDAAELLLREAVREREALLAADPGAPQHRFDLGMSHLQLGELARDRGQMHEALTWWRRGRDALVALIDELPRDHALLPEIAHAVDQISWFLVDDFLPVENQGPVAKARELDLSGGSWLDLTDGLAGLLSGDRASYRNACRALFERNGKTDDGWRASDLAMLCAIGQDSGIDPASYVPLAELGDRMLDPNTEQWRDSYLGLVYYRAGRYDDALRALDRSDLGKEYGIIGLDEHTTHTMAVRALCLHRLGRTEAARRALAQARRWERLLVFRNLSRPITSEGRIMWIATSLVWISLAEAEELIEGRTPQPEPMHHVLEALSEVQFGRPDRARACLDRLAPSAEADPDALAGRALVRSALGDTERAQADLETGLRIDPENCLARYVRGRLAIERGAVEEGADDLVLVLDQLPDSRNLNSLRYPVDMLLVQSEAAFARAVALRPNDPTLWIARGRFLAWNLHWREAADAYGHAIPARPIEIDWLEYAAVLVLAGDHAGYDRLRARVEGLMADSGRSGRPNDEWLFLSQSVRILALDPRFALDPTREPNIVERELLKLPANRWNWYFGLHTLAATLERTGGADRVVGLASLSLQDVPLWGSRELNWYILALAHQRLGNHADALRWLKRAEERFLRKLQVRRQSVTPPIGYYQCDDLEEMFLRRRAQALILDPVFPRDPFARSS
jgi:serine/threonine protein kinase/tetratricopeptide (TPR) repeat protein